MKHILYIMSLIIFCFTILAAQKIHSPAEIMEIMEKSKISYEIHFLEEEILTQDRSSILNDHNFYRIIDGENISIYEYKVDEKVQNLVQKIDYMAHWFLADIYKAKGEMDKAVDEITIAIILNRNNPRIKESLQSIYEANNLKTEEWSFNPQIKIDSISEFKVKIQTHENWIGYAFTKSVWKYEPGYKKSMGVDNSLLSTIEEKECLVHLLSALKEEVIKKNTSFNILNLALEKGMINEYIFYEIFFPNYPQIAYNFSEDSINKIKDYVKFVRSKK